MTARLHFFLTLLLTLVADLAVAQDSVTRGDALRRREYQTYSTLTYYVDPTGADTNACTASGTAACATVTGALNKVPLHLNNNVTINVANGTYTDTVVISNFSFRGASTVTLSITGSLTGFTVATGTNTGSITAFSDQPDTGSSLGTLTDSGQSWTVNDLKGRFIEITSGAQSGAVRPIINNTATAVSFAGSFATDPIIGVTYRISTPGAVWSSGGVSSVSGLLGRGTFTLSGIDQTVALTFSNNLLNNIQLGNSRIVTASGAGLNLTASRLTVPLSTPIYVFANSNAPALNVLPVPTSASFGGTLVFGNVYLRSAGTTQAALSMTEGSATLSSGGTIYLEGPYGMALNGAGFMASTSTRTSIIMDCGSSTAGIYLDGATSGRANIPSRINVYNTYFINCPTAFSLSNGARGRVGSGGTKTFSGVTNQVTLDGTVYTYSDVQSIYGHVMTPHGTFFRIE